MVRQHRSSFLGHLLQSPDVARSSCRPERTAYIGPAVMVFLLFCVGLVIFPSLGYALIAPIFFAALTTIEGHFVTPNIVGRNLRLSPLIVFLALAFWTWLWGPIGAFLATPILIIGLVVSKHFLPEEEIEVG